MASFHASLLVADYGSKERQILVEYVCILETLSQDPCLIIWGNFPGWVNLCLHVSQSYKDRLGLQEVGNRSGEAQDIGCFVRNLVPLLIVWIGQA